jgi:hypothetical protein
MMRTGLFAAVAASCLLSAAPAGAIPLRPADVTGIVIDSNWGGYVAIGNFHDISAQWREPAVTCVTPGTLQRVDPWIGLNGTMIGGGRIAMPLMQTGTDSMCASPAAVSADSPGTALQRLSAPIDNNSALFNAVLRAQAQLDTAGAAIANAGCAVAGGNAGPLAGQCASALYRRAWAMDYPSAFVHYAATPHPGDLMQAHVAFDGRRYIMTLADQTQHWSQSLVRYSTAPALTADIVVEGIRHNALPHFTPITFTNVLVDGRPLAAVPVVLQYRLGTVAGEHVPGPVNGSAFTIG